MATGWYFEFNGQVFGPISSEKLVEKVARGVVTPETKVRRSPNDPWVAARNIKGLVFDQPYSSSNDEQKEGLNSAQTNTAAHTKTALQHPTDDFYEEVFQPPPARDSDEVSDTNRSETLRVRTKQSDHHNQSERTAEYVQRLRENSQYALVRGFNNILSRLLLVVIVIAELFLLLNDKSEDRRVFVVSIPVAVCAAISVLVARQAAEIGIDLVDAALERNSRR